MMINWQAIETVLLDMDGTLLDLHFDNYFWRVHLPQRYAEIKEVNADQAQLDVVVHSREIGGSLNWYSTDYWSDRLDLDIVELKREICDKISLRPFCIEFLDALRSAGKEVVMVTNAHHDSLALKMEITEISNKFDRLITIHEFSMPKENPTCWQEVNQRHPFTRARTLFIDDNLVALQSAREYGISNLLAITQPDSKIPPRQVKGFDAIDSFAQILPVVEADIER